MGGVNQFRPTDVKQGELSDCWFLAALSVTAQRKPQALQELKFRYDDKKGACEVLFYKNFEEVPVVIDDRVPVTELGEPAFAKPRHVQEGGGLWVPLIEKAYAKLHHSYEAIAEGYVSDGLVDINKRGQGDQFNMHEEAFLRLMENGAAWPKILMWHNQGYLLGASTPDHPDHDSAVISGIVQGHAYGILDVREVEQHRLVKLRNPWADATEWKGDFSDKSPLWTMYLKKKLNFKDEDDGEFWMPFSDFTQHFMYVFVCRVFDDAKPPKQLSGQWKGKTAGGGPQDQLKFSQNPQYHLAVSGPTQLYITLTQEDKRDLGEPFHHIGLWLFDKDGKRAASCKKSTIVSRSSDYSNFRTTSLEIDHLAPKSEPYTLVPTTFDAGQEAHFEIYVYADSGVGVQFTPIPAKAPSA